MYIHTYLLPFINNFSRFCTIYTLKKRPQTVRAPRKYAAIVSKKLDKKTQASQRNKRSGYMVQHTQTYFKNKIYTLKPHNAIHTLQNKTVFRQKNR